MKINQVRAGAILSYISMFIGNAISIIYTPIMLRLLGQSEYGLMSLVSSIMSYLGLLSFGLSASYVRYNARCRANHNKEAEYNLNGTYMTVYLIISVISFICGLILVINSENLFAAKLTYTELYKAKILMFIAVVNISISFPISVFQMNINAYEKFVVQKLLNVISTILNPLIMLPLLLLGYKSVALTVATTVLTLIKSIITIIYCKKSLKIKIWFKKFDIALMRSIFVFSSFIFISNIIDVINWSVDKLLLGMFEGTLSVAIYAIGSQFNTYFISLSTSISSVLIPRVNKLVAEQKKESELSRLFIRIGRIQFIVLSLVLSGFIVYGKEFIMLWAGEDYENSYYIALLLLIPVIIPLIQNLGIEILQAKNKHKFRSLVYFAIAVLNLMISIPLCKFYGGIGCAIGTAISLIAGNGIIMNIYYYKRIGIDIIGFWKGILKLLPSLMIPIVLGLIIKIFIQIESILSLLMNGVIYVFAFVLSSYYIGMNEYEKGIMIYPIIKLIRKIKLVRLLNAKNNT